MGDMPPAAPTETPDIIREVIQLTSPRASPIMMRRELAAATAADETLIFRAPLRVPAMTPTLPLVPQSRCCCVLEWLVFREGFTCIMIVLLLTLIWLILPPRGGN